MFYLVPVLLCSGGIVCGQATDKPFVRVSPRDPRYFELSDGRPYIPIGLNMISPPGGDPDKALAGMGQWMGQLSANGGNFIRIWLSNGFFDVEHAKSGVYDEQKAKRIDAVLAMARKYDIRVKMTLEHFRHLGDGKQTWAGKPIHHVSQGGPAKDIVDFFASPTSQRQFKAKIAWYAKRYGDDPTIFAWELWNEFDAVQDLWPVEMWQEGTGVARQWTQIMLDDLHRQFPKNLATQSQGSFDVERKVESYRSLCSIPGNDIAQVHRYLDCGAAWEICHGPVDVLAAEAVTTLVGFELGKPVLLAESGAVEPSHSGPFKLYEKDRAGIILHDVLFAPFFAGAAGPGHCWHWDGYVAKNNLWHHFGRFAKSIRDLDPPAEQFRAVRIEHPRLRIYALAGPRMVIAWCRDKENTWQTELAEGRQPERLENQSIESARDHPPTGGFTRTHLRPLGGQMVRRPDRRRPTVVAAVYPVHCFSNRAVNGRPCKQELRMKGRIVGLLSAIILLSQVTMAWSEEQVDPYLWLEEVQGEKALEWVKARNDATLAVLKAQPDVRGDLRQGAGDPQLESPHPVPADSGEVSVQLLAGRKERAGSLAADDPEGIQRGLRRNGRCCWISISSAGRRARSGSSKEPRGLYPDYNLFLVELSRGGGDAVVVREFDASQDSSSRMASRCPRPRARFPGGTGIRSTWGRTLGREA